MKKVNVATFLKGFFILLVFAGALESAYRLILYIKYPNNFHFPKEDGTIVLYDAPQWQYDSHFGYTYPPVKIATSIIQNDLVTQCFEDTFTNIQGDVGVPVLDFDQAKNRILIFGDSFTARTVEGETWPHLLSMNLNRDKSMDEVRVRSLARDGYGVLQMLDLAAEKIRELKPTLVVFAFNSQAITRDRAWRVKVGEGDSARMLASTENSSNPHLKNTSDMEILMPAANNEWCKSMLTKSADDQRKDEILRKAIEKTLHIRQENGDLLKANIWDVSYSYIYNLLRHRDPFIGQWHKKISAANPVISYKTFKNDPQFLAALKAVEASGVPFVFIHLPMGISIRDHQEFYLDEQGQSLKQSLEELLGHKMIAMRSYIPIKDEDAMKLCMAPTDCHPSRFGMQMYADAIAKILTPMLKQENNNERA